MNVLPLPIATVPDARLLGLHSLWHPASVHVLREPYVRDAGGVITHEVHVRVEDDGVDWLVTFG